MSKFEEIFKYIKGQRIQCGIYALKRLNFLIDGTKQNLKYLQFYFDQKANIQIYWNIKNVIT